MRDYISILDRAYQPQPLLESVLLEYENFGQQQLAPAFAALYEQVKQREAQRAATDRMLADILSRHKNDITAAIESIKQHKNKTPASAPASAPGEPEKSPDLVADPSSRIVTSQPKQSAVQQVKHALQQYYTFLNRKVPLVSNSDNWIESKVKYILGEIEKIEDDSKFGKYKQALKKSVSWFREYQKNNPKKSMFVVATLGVISGLVTAGIGLGWVAPAIMIVIRLALMILNEEKFSTAVTKVISTSGLAVLAGYGIGQIMGGINSAQAATAMDTSGQTGGESLASEPPVSGSGTQDTTSAGAPAADPASTAANPVATTPYIDQLRQIVDPTGEGRGIPTMNQSTFGEAFRAAREAMGRGNIFVWNGNVYTTNTAQEGVLSGLSDAAKRFIRGAR